MFTKLSLRCTFFSNQNLMLPAASYHKLKMHEFLGVGEQHIIPGYQSRAPCLQEPKSSGWKISINSSENIYECLMKCSNNMGSQDGRGYSLGIKSLEQKKIAKCFLEHFLKHTASFFWRVYGNKWGSPKSRGAVLISHFFIWLFRSEQDPKSKNVLGLNLS